MFLFLPHLLANVFANPADNYPLKQDLLWAYRGKKGDVNLVAHSMKTRYNVVTAKPHFPMVAQPVFHRFIDPDHAKIALGVGVTNVSNEQLRTMNSVAQSRHIVSFLKIDNHIIAPIKFALPPRLGFAEEEKFALPPNSKLALKVFTSEAADPVRATGVTIDNDYGLSYADTVLMIVGRDAANLFGSASFYDKHGMKTGSHCACELAVEVSDTVYKSHINAINKAYDPDPTSPVGGRLLPLLLFDGKKHETSNPFALMTEDNRNNALAVFRNPLPTISGFKWNPSQQKVVDGKSSLTGKMQIITGCGGAGKTLLIMAMVQAALAGGDYALITSERNAVCDTLLDAITFRFPNMKPVRAYAKALTINQLAKELAKKEPEPEPEPEPEDSTSTKKSEDSVPTKKKSREMLADEMALNTLLLAKVDGAQQKRRGRSKYSVEAPFFPWARGYHYYRTACVSLCARPLIF